MEFSIETGDLQRAIKLLSVTAKVNTKDATGMILITANEDGTVEFFSNNFSTALSYLSDKAIVKIPGNVAVEYGKIKSFIMSYPIWDEKHGAKDFHFTLLENRLKISVTNLHHTKKASKGNLKLPIYDVYSIRRPPKFEQADFILNSTIFRTASSKVLYAIDPSDRQPSIQGMNINMDDESIYFVGTNGRMLSEYKVANVGEIKDKEYLLKYDFIMGLRRALGEETQLFFQFTERDVITKFDNVCFWGKTLIGHEYPDYKSLLSKFENQITIEKEVLMAGLAPFADVLNSDDNCRLTIELKNNKLKFYNDVAEFFYDGEVDFESEFIMDINGQYLTQTIETIRDDKIIVKFTDDSNVIIFDSGNFEDQKALVTPLRRR